MNQENKEPGEASGAVQTLRATTVQLGGLTLTARLGKLHDEHIEKKRFLNDDDLQLPNINAYND